MTGALQDYLEGWRPQPTREYDRFGAERARWLADILDAPGMLDRGVLPMTWHWVYFSGWPPSAQLNADGHPADGPFQPPIPQRRRMWAGGSLTSIGPLMLDVDVQRDASLLSATPKSGRSGEIIVVSVQHDYRQDGELRVREIQNHVYRSGADDGPLRAWHPRPTTPPTCDAPWRHDIVTDPVRLFRMSALTGNSHRIHYDRPYAVDVEGYPDLVVHGPLLAQQLAILAARASEGRQLEQLDYRLLAPVFVGDAVAATGRPNGHTAELAVLSGTDNVHANATARYRTTA